MIIGELQDQSFEHKISLNVYSKLNLRAISIDQMLLTVDTYILIM